MKFKPIVRKARKKKAGSKIKPPVNKAAHHSQNIQDNRQWAATPHKCPVCFGSGFVPIVLYQTLPYFDTAPKAQAKCRSCSGTGILWSYNRIQPLIE